VSTRLEGTISAANSLDRVHYSHDAMIDLMIAQPAISQGEIAQEFGYTQAWVSRVINSDAFLARLAERKTELIDPTIVATVDEKLRTLASKSLDIVIEKLTLNPTMDNGMKALEVATKALGYGARQDRMPQQNNFVVMLPPKSVDAGEWLSQCAPKLVSSVG
jgi:hypothetical protein